MLNSNEVPGIAENIRALLPPSLRHIDLKSFLSIPSTNSYLISLAESGEPGETAVVAKSQTAGRGRLGRSFYSPDSGLYISILIRPDIPPEKAALLTPYTAVAVSEALEKISGKQTAVKWVNDILIDGKKVCGILTESRSCGPDLKYAVVGIGVNLYTPVSGFPEDIKNSAGTLFSKNSDGLFENCAAEIIRCFFSYLGNFSSKTVFEKYKQKCITLKKNVSFYQNGEKITAFAEDIDRNFGLKVRLSDGSCIFVSSGEISIKL